MKRQKYADVMLTFSSIISIPIPSIFWLLIPRRTPVVLVVRNSNSTRRSNPTLNPSTVKWRLKKNVVYSSFSSVAQSSLTLCDPMKMQHARPPLGIVNSNSYSALVLLAFNSCVRQLYILDFHMADTSYFFSWLPSFLDYKFCEGKDFVYNVHHFIPMLKVSGTEWRFNMYLLNQWMYMHSDWLRKSQSQVWLIEVLLLDEIMHFNGFSGKFYYSILNSSTTIWKGSNIPKHFIYKESNCNFEGEDSGT